MSIVLLFDAEPTRSPVGFPVNFRSSSPPNFGTKLVEAAEVLKAVPCDSSTIWPLVLIVASRPWLMWSARIITPPVAVKEVPSLPPQMPYSAAPEPTCLPSIKIASEAVESEVRLTVPPQALNSIVPSASEPPAEVVSPIRLIFPVPERISVPPTMAIPAAHAAPGLECMRP